MKKIAKINNSDLKKEYSYYVGEDTLGFRIYRVIKIQNGEIIYASENYHNTFDKNSDNNGQLNKKAIYDTLERFRDENFEEFIAICHNLKSDCDAKEIVNTLVNELIQEMEIKLEKLKSVQEAKKSKENNLKKVISIK